MQGFGKRLKKLQKAVSETQAEFARRVDLSPSKLSAYISETNTPGADVLSSILNAFPTVNLKWLLLGEGEMFAGGNGIVRPGMGIPVVSRIAAGQPVQYYVDTHAEDRLPISGEEITRPGDTLFGLVVEGNSMEPWMMDGDIAICSSVQSVQVGDDVCVSHGGESTIKRLIAIRGRTRAVRLLPLNPALEDFEVDLAEGDHINKVVGLYRDMRVVRRRRRAV